MYWLKKVNNWFKIVQRQGFLATLLGARCLSCLAMGHAVLCQECEQVLPWYPQTDLSDLNVLFFYQPPLIQFVTQLKFQKKLFWAHWLGSKMIQNWPKPDVDIIIPVPLHPRRQQERGFNQTLEIAKVISKYWNLPLDRTSCRRLKSRPAQSSLSARQRARNIRASYFEISPSLQGKKILIVEDVITTGTTIKAFKQALINSKVEKITVWACCQTMKKSILTLSHDK